ncbi:Plasmodium exported protein, unknown function [Plasmodium malariae]|uniref:Variable surface protein n=1 Tax=Plasmodium malariae TaxID=5858 RepID=A0A1D3JMX8_PLAMA|nr:Plasmodium exported protein, unknown function [Plasmodium malariae]SBT88052.1 Plasmodium exported protein, unknown function [Plasmodium malariae]
MKVKSKLLLFIKIETFLILTWIYHFNSEVSNICKYLYEKDVIDEKLCTRNYRLLAKYRKEKCLNIAHEKKDIPYNGEYEKKHITKNGRVSKGKIKLPRECTSHNSVGYNQVGENKSSVNNKVNNYSGKRTLDKIYYKNVLRYCTNSDFKFIKKYIQRKDSEFFVLFIVHLIVGVIYALLFGLFKYTKAGEKQIIRNIVPIYILWIIILVGLFYICIKYIKYEKLLRIKRDMYYTKHLS